jgi:ribonuclease HI
VPLAGEVQQSSLFEDPEGEVVSLPVVVYTDGGCDPNPGPGGWAAVLRFPDREVVLSGGTPQSTNNRMELEAALAALAYLEGRYGPRDPVTSPLVEFELHVDLYTDSEYLRLGITRWLRGWLARGWLTKGGAAVKNQALWRRLHALTQALPVRWHWVKGHAGHAANERVDRLAAEARDRRGEFVPPGPVPAPATGPAPAREASAREASGAPRDKHIEISIGVSYQGETGMGGWAACLRSGEGCKMLRGRARETTANALTLRAAVEALNALDAPAEVTVHTVSDYLGRGASEWVRGWQQRGWRTSGGAPVQNRALWEALLDAARRHRVTWRVAGRGAPPPADLSAAKDAAAKSAAAAKGQDAQP